MAAQKAITIIQELTARKDRSVAVWFSPVDKLGVT